MTRPGDSGRDDTVCGPCRIDECEHCDGNIDLKVGPGPAVPLVRCAHRCRRGRDKPLAADFIPNSG